MATLTGTEVAAAATALDDAFVQRHAVPRITDEHALDVASAYDVQRALVARRLGRDETLVGVKMGFTSIAKMRQMGVDDLIWGRLTDAMGVPDAGEIDAARFIHPRVEPEIAFCLDRPLAGPVTGAQAAAAIGAVAPAFEVIDSRYEGFRFSLPDVIADNSSSAAFGTGPWRAARRMDLTGDLGCLGMLLELDGRVAQAGSSAAILGHPLRSVVAAARLAAEAGLRLEAGWVILAGAATAAAPLSPGTHVRVTTSTLGRAEAHA